MLLASSAARSSSAHRSRAFLIRVLVASSAVIATVAVLAGAAVTRFVERAFIEQVARDNDHLAADLAGVFGAVGPSDRGALIDRIQARIERIRIERGFVCVVDETGLVLAHPDRQVVAMKKSFGDGVFVPATGAGAARPFRAALAAGPAAGVIDFGPMGVEIVASRPLGESGLVVNVHQYRDGLERILLGVRRRLAAIGLGFMAILIVVAAAVIRREVRRYEAVIASHEAEIRNYSENLEVLVKQRTQQLLRAEKLAAVGTLVQGISHNLKSPLTAILGFSALLADDRPDDEAPKQIHEAATQMCGMIETLTKEGRRSSDRAVRPVDLNDVIRGAFRILEGNLFFRNDVERRLELGTIPAIEGVYSDFSQSFMNLIQNAIDALHGSPRRVLVARTRQEEGAVVVEIEDSGPGIPDAVRERLFDPFFTTKPLEAADLRPAGTGLGLWSVRRLLDPYGATVSFESRPGRTVFRVDVLVRAAAGVAAASLEPAAPCDPRRVGFAGDRNNPTPVAIRR